jgi:hypothetical protein
MPEHNSQQLLYAAMSTGQLQLAEEQTQVAVNFPKQYGPGVMADGEERYCCLPKGALRVVAEAPDLGFLHLVLSALKSSEAPRGFGGSLGMLPGR